MLRWLPQRSRVYPRPLRHRLPPGERAAYRPDVVVFHRFGIRRGRGRNTLDGAGELLRPHGRFAASQGSARTNSQPVAQTVSQTASERTSEQASHRSSHPASHPFSSLASGVPMGFSDGPQKGGAGAVGTLAAVEASCAAGSSVAAPQSSSTSTLVAASSNPNQGGSGYAERQLGAILFKRRLAVMNSDRIGFDSAFE